MNPEQALQAVRELRAKMMIPMHFGTFRLSYEPLHEPPRRLLEKALELQILDKIRLLNEGEPTVF
jgi:L-ascorbate metabolism protein UlaG (beta-lactamase superfamily)